MKRLLLVALGFLYTPVLPMSMSLSLSREHEIQRQRYADMVWQQQQMQQALAMQQTRALSLSLSLTAAQPKEAVRTAPRNLSCQSQSIALAASVSLDPSGPRGGSLRPAANEMANLAPKEDAEEKYFEKNVIDGRSFSLCLDKYSFWRSILSDDLQNIVRKIGQEGSCGKNKIKFLSLYGQNNAQKVEVARVVAAECGFCWFQLRSCDDFNVLNLIIKKMARATRPVCIIMDNFDSMSESNRKIFINDMLELQKKAGQIPFMFILISNDRLFDSDLSTFDNAYLNVSYPSYEQREFYIADTLRRNGLMCDNETITVYELVKFTRTMSYDRLYEFMSHAIQNKWLLNRKLTAEDFTFDENFRSYKKEREEKIHYALETLNSNATNPYLRRWVMGGLAAAIIGGCYWLYNKFF